MAGKYQAKERLRGKAVLPLKTEQLHLQRVCIFLKMKKKILYGLGTKESLVFVT